MCGIAFCLGLWHTRYSLGLWSRSLSLCACQQTTYVWVLLILRIEFVGPWKKNMPETSPNTLFKAAKMKSEEMQLPHTVEHVNRHCAGVDPPCIQCLATLIMSAKIHYQNYHFSSHSWVWIMGNDRSTFQFYYTSYRGRYCENEKERKWNKDSIKTQTLPIKFEVWSTVSYLDENGIKFIIFVMSSVQVD